MLEACDGDNDKRQWC